jgi:prevent-host-death family protein
MGRVGLRELRQNASELVRRVEAGETFSVTVSGRAVARLVPVERDTWRRWEEIADVFAGPPDQEWNRDRDLVDQQVRNPFVA